MCASCGIVLNFRKFISQSRHSVGAHWRSMGTGGFADGLVRDEVSLQ